MTDWTLPFPPGQPNGPGYKLLIPEEVVEESRELWVSTYRAIYQKYLPVGPSWLSSEDAATHSVATALAGSFAWQSAPNWRTVGAMPAWVHQQLAIEIVRIAHASVGTPWTWTPGHDSLVAAWESELSKARVVATPSVIDKAYKSRLSVNPDSLECRLGAKPQTTQPVWVNTYISIISEADSWRVWARNVAILLWHDANSHFPWCDLSKGTVEELAHLFRYIPIFGLDNEPLYHESPGRYAESGLGGGFPCSFHGFYPLEKFGGHAYLDTTVFRDDPGSKFCYMPGVEERNPLITWRIIRDVYDVALGAWPGKPADVFAKDLTESAFLPYWADLTTGSELSQSVLQFLVTERVLDCIFDGVVSLDGAFKRDWQHGNFGRVYPFARLSKYSNSWMPGFRLMTTLAEYSKDDYYQVEDISFFLSDDGDPSYTLPAVLRKKIGGCHTAASAAARVLRSLSIAAWKSSNDAGHGFVFMPHIQKPNDSTVGWGLPHGDAHSTRRALSRGYRWRSGWRDEVLVSTSQMNESGQNFGKSVLLQLDFVDDKEVVFGPDHFGYQWYSRFSKIAVLKLFGGWKGALERTAASTQEEYINILSASQLASVPLHPGNSVDGRSCLDADTITILSDALEISRPGDRQVKPLGDGGSVEWTFGSMLGDVADSGDSPFLANDVVELRSQLAGVMWQWRLDGSYGVESKQFPPPSWFGDEPVDPPVVCEAEIQAILHELDEARAALATRPAAEAVLALMARWVPKGTIGTRQLALFEPSNPQLGASFALTPPTVSQVSELDVEYGSFVCGGGTPLLTLPEIAVPRLRLAQVLVRNWTWPSTDPQHASGGIYLGDLPGSPLSSIAGWSPAFVAVTPYPPMRTWFEDCGGYAGAEEVVSEKLLQARAMLTTSQGSPAKGQILDLMRKWLPPIFASGSGNPNVALKLTASYATGGGKQIYRIRMIGTILSPGDEYWWNGGIACGGVGLFNTEPIALVLAELQRVLVANWAMPLNWSAIESIDGTYVGDQPFQTLFDSDSIPYPPTGTWFK